MRLAYASISVLLATTACSDDTDTSEEGTGGTGGAGGTMTEITDDEPILPTPTGVCPEFTAGEVTFAPEGIGPRTVRLFMDETAVVDLDGPLVFYWHGAGSSPLLEPPYGMGQAQYWVQNNGGVIAAPVSDDAAGQFEWYLTTGGDNEADLILADEVVACAIEKIGIDTTHIHSMGMSAGGLNTTQMSYRRSNYLASVVAYSGGLLDAELEPQREANKLPAMMFHGGPTDEVIIQFQPITEAWLADIQARGHFGFICNHGAGHIIPKDQNEQAAVETFFADHPFGTFDSPYAAGLPAGFPSYCSL